MSWITKISQSLESILGEGTEEEIVETTSDFQEERVQLQPVSQKSVRELPARASKARGAEAGQSLGDLHERQQELLGTSDKGLSKTTIDIKFPKRYEDTPEMVNLLLANSSVLIDFQYMSEQQARRCLDYLDGARSVLSGNLKKVSNTMWLLTPVNVTVHIEDLRQVSTQGNYESNFDFDLRR